MDGIAVFTRPVAGENGREVMAVGAIDAPPEKVFQIVTDYEHQVGNMPYVEDQAVFARSEKEVVFWAVADFPMISRRDWLLRSKLERNLPGGVWRASWEPAPDAGAPRPGRGVVRLTRISGSWTLEPLEGGKRTRAVCRLLTDPGGSIPGLMADRANTSVLPRLFAQVRKRAGSR